MTFNRLHITAFLGIAVLVWLAVLLILGTPVSFHHLAPFGTVVGVLAVLAIAFEHILWRLPWLHGWFVQRPNLRGTWQVTLKSDWVDPQTQQPVPPITCYAGVEQTLSRLQVHLMTPESESWFVAHGIRPSASGKGYQIAGVYTNKPQLHLRGVRSEIHFGAIVIDTHGSSTLYPESLTAEYWTDRRTSGQMTFAKRMPEVFTQYTEARKAFEQTMADPNGSASSSSAHRA